MDKEQNILEALKNAVIEAVQLTEDVDMLDIIYKLLTFEN